MSTELPEGPVRRLLDAVSRGDADAFVALFDDDGVVDDWGRVFAGRDQVGYWNASEFIGLQARLTVRHIDGRSTVVADISTVGGYVGPVTLTFLLTEDGQHIRRMIMAD